MDKSKTLIFIFLTSVVVLVLIVGIILIVFQYRRRKLLYLKETDLLNKEHTKELLSSQLRMQQQTMQFIGREIHDSVGQKLTLASLYIQQLCYKNNLPQANEQLTAIGTILNESLAELRSLSKNLTDETQQQQSLDALLQQECERINASGICHASVSGGINGIALHQEQKNVLLRITQEFIQNSLKHSGCKNILLNSQHNENGLYLFAEDDGKGFDLEKIEKEKTGIGLHNMKRRAHSIGATVCLTSEPAKGTHLELFLPLTA